MSTLNHGAFKNHHDFEYKTPDLYSQSSTLDSHYLSSLNKDKIFFYGGYASTDLTSYTQASKNGEDPTDWDTGPANVTPKNDLIDCFAHLRRDGVTASDSLWLFLAFSRISNTGNPDTWVAPPWGTYNRFYSK